jgi:deoxycytidine triphosphate deaminase
MIISGAAITRGVQEGRIGITPFSVSQVEAAHVNLHLGESQAMEGDTLVVKAGQFVLARTLERITLPDTICGSMEGRSKLAQQGLSVEQSSTFIEPGSDTTMVLEIHNVGPVEVCLKRGQKIAKMILMRIVDDF